MLKVYKMIYLQNNLLYVNIRLYRAIYIII
nr:MAG TPA: hypothetical protein [Caudoviricetes sp.]